MEKSETSKVFIGRKRAPYMWIDTWEGSERVSCPCGILNRFYGEFLPGFLWPVTLICLVLCLHVVYLRILPCVCTQTSVSQDGFHQRPMGSWHHLLWGGTPPFSTPKELSSFEGFLDLESKKYVVSYLLSGPWPASCLDYPAFDILEFQSMVNELKLLYLGVGEGFYLLP